MNRPLSLRPLPLIYNTGGRGHGLEQQNKALRNPPGGCSVSLVTTKLTADDVCKAAELFSSDVFSPNQKKS